MSEQGLETFESTTQKTHEWIARIAETMQMEKRDAYKSLCATVTSGSGGSFRRPVTYAGAREPSRVPIKMSCQEFLDAVRAKIVADRVIDPAETVQNFLAVVASHMASDELQKVMHSFPRDMQSLFRALASAA